MYKLEERLMRINEGRFVYTMAIFDCPRKIVSHRKRQQPVAAKPAVANLQEEQKEQREISANMIMVYACAIDEAEQRDLAFDLPAHWQAK